MGRTALAGAGRLCPNGRVLSVSADRSHRAPHVCDACALPFVQLEDAVPAGSRWRALLHCSNCGWESLELLDRKTLDRLDEELDKETDELLLALELLTSENLREYADRFAAALAVDAILPEDF
jgi:hypothetical protein